MNMQKHAHKVTLLIVVTCLLALVAGCEKKGTPVKGFVLPAGDVALGQEAFIAIGCPQCHTVAGVTLPEPTGKPEFQVRLGGKVRHVRHYGELLTSVVYPDHRVAFSYRVDKSKQDAGQSASPMPSFANQMTVAQLINIVEFLHSTYKLNVPEYRGAYYSYVP